MRAVILAAGVGDRMGDAAGGKPKCLLEFGGATLLSRHLRVLAEQPLTGVTLVAGYRHEAIENELKRLGTTAAVQMIINPDFRRGSVVSLWCSRPALDSGDDVVLMDADVLCHPEVLRRLFRTPHANCFLLDRDFETGDEPVKLCVSDGRIVEFRKQIGAGLRFDDQGESVGFFRFASATARALAAGAAEYVDSGRSDAPYEEVIRDLLLRDPPRFAYEDITGLPWIELDFPRDVARARDEILPKIAQNS